MLYENDMGMFAAFFNEIFGKPILVIWIVPPLILLAAVLIYIIAKTIRELKKWK